MSILAKDAFADLYPSEDSDQYEFSIKYSHQLKPYNGNVRRVGNDVQFHFNKRWQTVSKEIQMGLCQELLLKIFGGKKQTLHMDLYAHFMKSIHIAAPKTHDDPHLRRSFDRVNTQFFDDDLEITNLKWGKDSTTKLGCYEYGSDTITISSIFKEGKQEHIDYIMYHELLHKKLKFSTTNGRNLYHSKAFKDLEAQFPNQEQIEKELNHHATKYLRKKSLGFW